MAVLGLPADFFLCQTKRSKKPWPQAPLLGQLIVRFDNRQNNSFQLGCYQQPTFRSDKFCRLSAVVKVDNS